MPSNPHAAASAPLQWRRADSLLLAALILLTVALRLPMLGQPGYLLDEAWTSEVAVGRGSVHLSLPLGVPMPPPDLFTLRNAPPWWHVWTHMQVTHPPLYFTLLRLWMNLLGRGDAIERSLSVLCSAIAVAFLFDAARLLNGRTVATWACVLMAIAPPQILYGRATRNYAMELAAALAATDALIRIEMLGANWRRTAALATATLGALLTHYFCVGFLAGLGMYALVRLRGQKRVSAISAFAVAASLFVLCWGPFMWKQRALFSTQDMSTLFLRDQSDWPARESLKRAMTLPYRMLAEPSDSTALTPASLRNASKCAAGAALLYVLPFALRRNRGLLLWGFCLIGTVGVILLLDLIRQTCHLGYVRYVLPAGPAVYVLIPAVAAGLQPRWLRHVLPAAAALTALLAIAQGYQTAFADPRQIARDIDASTARNNFFIFAATGDSRWQAFADYLQLSRYAHPLPGPIALLNNPATPAVAAQARTSQRTFLFTANEDARLMFPQLRCIGFRTYYGFGQVWLMEPVQSQSN